jgi:3-oxoacyl-[acyl-carrier-protein] synthase II
MSERRVVITGLGALTPIGNDVESFWNNALAGTNGVKKITKFDTAKFKTKFAAEITDFDPNKYLTRQEIKRNDLYTQYALHVCAEAMEDSGLDIESMDPFDAGVIWGSGQGGLTTMEQEIISYVENDKNPRYNPFLIPKFLTNMAAGLVSMKFGLMGINYATVSACATANSAMMDAFNYIKMGKAKVFLTGASESPISDASIGGFNALKALATDNDNFETASRPFDRDRSGFVMGEGAACIILEDYEHAKTRGAKIYAEMLGASMTADAYHMTASHPEGKGASVAMEKAISESGLKKSQINYLNAHATSTPKGDIAEVNALSQVFAEHKETLNIGASKSMTGHLLGAAGAIEAILCIKSVQEDIIPPTINTKVISEEIGQDWNIVLNKAKKTTVEGAMSNSFGFGGHNTVSIFGKAPK